LYIKQVKDLEIDPFKPVSSLKVLGYTYHSLNSIPLRYIGLELLTRALLRKSTLSELIL
jgi:hypothetical protein